MNKTTLKSIGAIFTAFVFVVVLSIGTDTLLEKTGLMKKPFHNNSWLFIVFVIFYRSLYGTIGAYITAALAPNRPMRLAMIGGIIGFVLSIIGAIAMWDIPPHWYGISLIITALPCAWLGGKIFVSRNRLNESGKHPQRRG